MDKGYTYKWVIFSGQLSLIRVLTDLLTFYTSEEVDSLYALGVVTTVPACFEGTSVNGDGSKWITVPIFTYLGKVVHLLAPVN